MIDMMVRGGKAVVTFDRPPVNALDLDMVARLAAIVTDLENETTVKVVVLRSARKVFCAGADIRMMAGFLAEDDGPEWLTAYAVRLQSVLGRLHALPVVTMAEVNGAATGGGLELALACNIQLAAESAKLGLTEANIGLVPGAGGTQRLTSAVGRPQALLTLLSGELLTAPRAYAMGVVTELWPDDQLRDRVDTLADLFAGRERNLIVEVKACVAAAGTPTGFQREIFATERLASITSTRDQMNQFLNRKRK
jgi:enoyl-CoA hydratase